MVDVFSASGNISAVSRYRNIFSDEFCVCLVFMISLKYCTDCSKSIRNRNPDRTQLYEFCTKLYDFRIIRNSSELYEIVYARRPTYIIYNMLRCLCPVRPLWTAATRTSGPWTLWTPGPLPAARRGTEWWLSFIPTRTSGRSAPLVLVSVPLSVKTASHKWSLRSLINID